MCDTADGQATHMDGLSVDRVQIRFVPGGTFNVFRCNESLLQDGMARCRLCRLVLRGDETV